VPRPRTGRQVVSLVLAAARRAASVRAGAPAWPPGVFGAANLVGRGPGLCRGYQALGASSRTGAARTRYPTHRSGNAVVAGDRERLGPATSDVLQAGMRVPIVSESGPGSWLAWRGCDRSWRRAERRASSQPSRWTPRGPDESWCSRTRCFESDIGLLVPVCVTRGLTVTFRLRQNRPTHAWPRARARRRSSGEPKPRRLPHTFQLASHTHAARARPPFLPGR
jgi:hypothetical protein